MLLPAMLADLRVGAYIDGMNLYHGGRRLCGRGTPGWRWLDLSALVENLLGRNPSWIAQGATLHRVVYCTALISRETDRSGRRHQEAYLEALVEDDRIQVELGRFITRRVRGESEEEGVTVTVAVPAEKGSSASRGRRRRSQTDRLVAARRIR